MNVWLLRDHYDETSLIAWDKNPLEHPYVETELGYLTGGYEDEREEFLADVESMRRTGRGTARIEERFSLEVKSL